MKKFYIYKVPLRSKHKSLISASDLEEIIDSIDIYCSGFFFCEGFLISDKEIKVEHLLLFPTDFFEENLSRPIKLSFIKSFILRGPDTTYYWPLVFAHGFGKRFSGIKKYGEGLYKELTKSCQTLVIENEN